MGVVLHVERLHPLVQAGHLVTPVGVGGAAQSIVWRPEQLRGKQEGRPNLPGKHQLLYGAPGIVSQSMCEQPLIPGLMELIKDAV